MGRDDPSRADSSQLLGLDPDKLQAVREEGTRVLPGIGDFGGSSSWNRRHSWHLLEPSQHDGLGSVCERAGKKSRCRAPKPVKAAGTTLGIGLDRHRYRPGSLPGHPLYTITSSSSPRVGTTDAIVAPYDRRDLRSWRAHMVRALTRWSA
jgi:hypothetical protein